MRFQILSLSGGGYRGLFTVEVLAKLEAQAGRPIGECFDLIAGTSIGGIVAIGLAMGKSAAQIRDVFLERGEAIFPFHPPVRPWPLRYWDLYRRFKGGPKYADGPLRRTVEGVVGTDTRIGDAGRRLLVPAVNMTSGSVQMFKTPHHPGLVVDRHLKAADVAMATSAAPTYFPLARIGNSLFADGGLAANSPDACAIHEAVHFLGRRREEVHVLSVGTTMAGFGLPASLGREFGGAEWFKNGRLVATVFGVQQQLVDYMVGHELPENYVRLDALASAEHAVDLGLDVASVERRETLLGLAQMTYQRHCADVRVKRMLKHEAPAQNFHVE